MEQVAMLFFVTIFNSRKVFRTLFFSGDSFLSTENLSADS